MDRRDDLFPIVTAGVMATGMAAALVTNHRRRQVVLRGRHDERQLSTTSGNVLSYRLSGPPIEQVTGPVIVFESGLLGSIEQAEWLARQLGQRFTVVTYHRAGYGASRYAGGRGFRLGHAVDDLIDLIGNVLGGRDVVLLGHSLSGYLALLAAGRLADQVRGVGLVDARHPGQLQRSSGQKQGTHALNRAFSLTPGSLVLGLGPLMRRPDWLAGLPKGARELALARYRDARGWAAAQREWRAVREEFSAVDGRLPDIDVPLLVVTAGLTVRSDPTHLDLQKEYALAAPRSVSHVLEDADHNGILADRKYGERVADLVAEFVADLYTRHAIGADHD